MREHVGLALGQRRSVTARNCLVYGFGRKDRKDIGNGLGWAYFPGARNARKHAFQQRSDGGELPSADDQVPERLEFFPACGIEEVLGLVLERAMMQRGARDGSPPVKLTIRPVVPRLQGFGLKLRRPIDDMSSVVKIPVSRQHAPLTHHSGVQLRSGIGRLNMKGCCGDPAINGPIYRAPEHVFTVIIHAKDKAAIDHDAERVQAVCHLLVVTAQILSLVASLEVLRCKRLKPHEDAAQSRLRGTLDQVAAQNGIHGCCALKQPLHALHAIKQRFPKTPITEQMIVKEIEMTSGQPLDLSQRIIHSLCVESSATLKECVFIAEITMLRTSARHDNGIRHQIIRSPNEIAANWRNTLQGTACR